ncbi:MAG: DegT/DnrJ/EryC1/StrS family aminotransferase [Syntrophomonadaceae bacterium]|nr:DegT/DnrJ/EryC1/StrS family aminotransferase [Syntrophomonadaceae bacterium]
MQPPIKIPFLDLQKQYQSIKPEIDDAIQNIIETAHFIKGKAVHDFEQSFADYVGAQYCIGVGNGTDALILALKAMGIGRGDEVITVPNTFIATVEAIVAAGADPVLLDINYETYTMDPGVLAQAITGKTKAIIPVHLYGMPCDMDAIMNIAAQYKLKVICDGAQAHGARYKQFPMGMYGDVTTYSFYPGKNLGAFGDGGAVVTNDEELANRIRMLADHGRLDKYLHHYCGYNSRLDAIQAAVLSVKLKYLEKWNNRRKEIAAIYNRELASIDDVSLITVPAYAEPAWHIYLIRTSRRDELQEYLSNRGIQTGIHYPVPITHQPAGQSIRAICNYDQLETMSRQILSLPMCPEMSDDMVNYVIENIKGFFSK